MRISVMRIGIGTSVVSRTLDQLIPLRMEVEFVGPKSNQIGMSPELASLRWLWEMRFSAVAGDTRVSYSGFSCFASNAFAISQQNI